MAGGWPILCGVCKGWGFCFWHSFRRISIPTRQAARSKLRAQKPHSLSAADKGWGRPVAPEQRHAALKGGATKARPVTTHPWATACRPKGRRYKGPARALTTHPWATACRPKGRRYKGPARALTKNLSFHTDSSGAASPAFHPSQGSDLQVLLEHEDATLASEAHLLQFSVGAEKDGIVASFLSALF